LLGISYYALTQWQVAARNPKGLAAIVPWEGFSDEYRDSARHGGILSNTFIQRWWDRQIGPNQYGLPGRASRNWGPDTVEGDLPEDELKRNAIGLFQKLQSQRFRDDPRFASTNFNLEDVRVPLLSVANWGGYLLHLRGNVEGFTWASSEFKYLRFITGKHDLPFYYHDEVELQRSFLDAFLKGEDREGWSQKGALPLVDLVLRKGDVGYNNPEGEALYPRRKESEWPLARTRYTKSFLTPDQKLVMSEPEATTCKLGYRALGSISDPQSISFRTAPFQTETEITGHIVVRLNVSVSKDPYGSVPSDIDLFLTLRHFSSAGKEIVYTGTVGDPVPVTKGFLRVSLRKINREHPHHREYLPYRNYFSSDIQPVIPNEVYQVDVEMWPTNVVVQEGGTLALEVSSGDTSGAGIFEHNDPIDR
jgi:predicted acyl esterase